MKKRRASRDSRVAKPRRADKKESGYVRVRPLLEADEAVPASAVTEPATSREPSFASPPADAPRGDASRRARDSHVRLCSDVAPLGRVDEVEAHDLLDEISEECAEVESRLDRLERASSSLESHARPRPQDPASQAAFDALDACIAELRRTRVALAGLQRAGAPRSVHHAFAFELGDHLRGLCAWVHAVMAAIGQLIAELWASVPEYLKYRARIDAARNLHFDELEPSIRAGLVTTFDVTSDLHVRDLRDAFDVLVKAGRDLETRLDHPIAG